MTKFQQKSNVISATWSKSGDNQTTEFKGYSIIVLKRSNAVKTE